MINSCLKSYGVVLFWALVVMALWEAAYRAGLLSPLIFGSPSLIFRAAITDYRPFLLATRVTLFETICALAIAWSGGIVLGALTGRDPFINAVSQPMISAIIAIPLVVLYPFIIVWFGIGPASKIAFGAILGIFPVASNSAVGIRSIEQGYLSAVAAMGATRLQMIVQVMLPLAMPAILNGLRLGSSLVIAGVILAEMLASTDGLGYLISAHRTLFNTGQVYLGTLLALAIAAAVNGILSFLDRRFRIRPTSDTGLDRV